MDGFSYTNIFETKGIEYLAIIAFFIILIPFWILLNKQAKISKQIKRIIGILSASVLKIPQGLFFSKNHTWTHLERSGSATVGLDDLLLHITGTVNFRNLKNPGDMINKGDLLTEVNQNGKILRIFSPISGKILASNTLLKDNPELSSEDPYGKGWIYKIKPTSWIAETSSYYLAEEAMLEEVTAVAVKRVISWQIEQEMKAQSLTKTAMAKKMHTSRAALNRLLDETDTSLTLTTLASAAAALGKKVRLELSAD